MSKEKRKTKGYAQTAGKLCLSLLVTAGLCGPVLSSCSKDGGNPAEEPVMPKSESVFVHSAKATFDVSTDTKSTVSGSQLLWEVGDRLILVGHGEDYADDPRARVIGELTCYQATAGTGKFSGTLEDFWVYNADEADKTRCVMYYLGGNSVGVGGTSYSGDLSTQFGSLSGINKSIFLRCGEVHINEPATEGSEVYPVVPAAGESLKLMFHLLTIDLSAAGDGQKATKVKMDKVASKFTIDLTTWDDSTPWTLTDSASPSGLTITPTSPTTYSTSYTVAIVPQNIVGAQMAVDYQSNGGYGTSKVFFNNIDWNLSTGPIGLYTTLWDNQDDDFSISNSLVYKGGYDAVSIEGGTADGKSGKGGYNGGNADGAIENPTVNKGGYNGEDLDYLY